MSPASRRQLEADLEQHREQLAALPRVNRETVARVMGLTEGNRRVIRVVDAWRPEPEAGPGPDQPTVEVRHEGDELVVEATGTVRNLEELAAAAQIDLTEWCGDGFQVRTWTAPMRRRSYDAQGRRTADEVVVVRSWYVSARFRRRLDRLVAPETWTPLRRAPSSGKPSQVAAVLVPDIHVGYRWSRGHQQLVSLHDWAAVDAVLQLIGHARPAHVQNLGDGLDFAAFSTKFPVPLALRDTARPALLTAHAILRAQREAAPEAEIDWQGGNHDDRPERGVVGTEYDDLVRADDPHGPPVLSFAHLLGLDRLDVSWRRYGEHRWLLGRILVHHGDKVKSRGGLTVAEVIRDAQHSTVFGHIHRVEQASRTLHGPDGPRVITAASPGTLARIDGSVPGVTRRPDWQQGVGLVYLDARGQEHLELVHIHEGALYWRGLRIEGDGRRLAAEVAERIGYPQAGP